MKIFSIINKCIKEQLRSFWILILTISFAPFFVLVIYLIDQSTKEKYDITIVNFDKGIQNDTLDFNYGNYFLKLIGEECTGKTEWFLIPKSCSSKDSAILQLEKK